MDFELCKAVLKFFNIKLELNFGEYKIRGNIYTFRFTCDIEARTKVIERFFNVSGLKMVPNVSGNETIVIPNLNFKNEAIENLKRAKIYDFNEEDNGDLSVYTTEKGNASLRIGVFKDCTEINTVFTITKEELFQICEHLFIENKLSEDEIRGYHYTNVLM